MIEITKRPSYIITGFVFSTFIFVVFLLIVLLYSYPQIKEIGIQKADAMKNIKNYQELKKKGISFEEFDSLKKSYKTSIYNASLLKKVDRTFFDTNFTNKNPQDDFDIFIKKVIADINKKESNENLKKIKESYKNILPTYVEDNYENEEGVMTDFKFVTYIESILHTFNLDIPNKNLNVGNLNILEDYNTNQESSLDTTIFYIPYTFDITGKKTDILDFIYFLENVGSIKENEDGTINIVEDNFIKKSLLGFDNGNIFENQIIDIEKIQITDYIDSGLQEKTQTENLIDFIKRTQGNEKLTISIDVRFYVKGVPNYKIMDSIEKLNTRYQEIKTEYSKQKNNKDLTEDKKNALDKGLSYLKELDTTIMNIKKEKTDLNKKYKKVLEVNKLLDTLQNILKQ